MAINAFDAKTTQQLSIGLLAAAGALTFNAFQLIAAGLSAGDKVYSAGISDALVPLQLSLQTGLFSFILATFAAHPEMPTGRGPWSVANHLQTAFAMLSVLGLGGLVVGGYMLFRAAAISLP